MKKAIFIVGIILAIIGLGLIFAGLEAEMTKSTSSSSPVTADNAIGIGLEGGVKNEIEFSVIGGNITVVMATEEPEGDIANLTNGSVVLFTDALEGKKEVEPPESGSWYVWFWNRYDNQRLSPCLCGNKRNSQQNKEDSCPAS